VTKIQLPQLLVQSIFSRFFLLLWLDV